MAMYKREIVLTKKKASANTARRIGASAAKVRGLSRTNSGESSLVKRSFVSQLKMRLFDLGVSKTALAARMGTSRQQLDRLLDPENGAVTLRTLVAAASAVDRGVNVSLTDPSGKARIARAVRASGSSGGLVVAHNPLNLYGDALIESTGKHGSDIASQRLDELDRKSLCEVIRWTKAKPICLDLGCGHGSQGLRFALLGGRVWLYDLLPVPRAIEFFRDQASVDLAYYQADLANANARIFPKGVDIVYAQRFIHYLRYEQARELLTMVGSRMRANARVFISASGLETELGTGYVGQEVPVEHRFSPLIATMQAKHGIFEPVCLYRAEDLARLLKESGFEQVELWRSPFGNVKGIFEKRA